MNKVQLQQLLLELIGDPGHSLVERPERLRRVQEAYDGLLRSNGKAPEPVICAACGGSQVVETGIGEMPCEACRGSGLDMEATYRSWALVNGVPLPPSPVS